LDLKNNYLEGYNFTLMAKATKDEYKGSLIKLTSKDINYNDSPSFEINYIENE
jgi:hypothetical protein